MVVEWYDSRPPALNRTIVALTGGYSDESDIPKILAIRYLHGVGDAEYVQVVSARELTE